MKVGHLVRLPDLPGRWQVWSQCSEAPGAHFFVPYDQEAHDAAIKVVVAKVINSKQSPYPVITVLRVEGKR